MHGTMFALHVVKICFNITDGNVVEVNADKKINCLVYVVEENKLLLRACHWLHVFFFSFSVN